MNTTISISKEAYVGLRPIHVTLERLAKAVYVEPRPEMASHYNGIFLNGRFLLPHTPKLRYNVAISPGIFDAIRLQALNAGYIHGGRGNVSAYLEAIGLNLYEVYP